ncbi:hypothetical protein ACFVH0_14955 [Streptomyces sp. NPDC127117]|uniref:hypothetical protein n=1 Tax=Streptomyces sp. NPDC127117 TaxID=3345368 RepID=UPI00364585C0
MNKKPIVTIDAGSFSVSDETVGGVGIHAAEMAQVLSEEFTVRLIATPTSDPVHLGSSELVSTEEDTDKVIAETDVVIFFDTADRSRFESAVSQGKLIASDCRPALEQLDYPSILTSDDPSGVHRRIVDTHVRQLTMSHHFLCRSQVDRISLISNLCAFGRIAPSDVQRSRTLDHLISMTPVGFSRHSARAADRAESRYLADFLWTGGVWAYYSPELLISAIGILKKRGVAATAAFLYAAPSADNREILAGLRQQINDAELSECVLLHSEPLPHSRRDSYLKAARAFVSVAKPGVENETSVRLRVRDSKLHGIPTISDGHGETGTLISRDALGIVLPQADAEHLADAMEQIISLGDSNSVGRRSEFLYEETLFNFKSWLGTLMR